MFCKKYQITTLFNDNNNDFRFNDIVFRCGGRTDYAPSDYCGAIIMNPRQFQAKHDENIIGYNWELPVLPNKINSNVVPLQLYPPPI